MQIMTGGCKKVQIVVVPAYFVRSPSVLWVVRAYIVRSVFDSTSNGLLERNYFRTDREKMGTSLLRATSSLVTSKNIRWFIHRQCEVCGCIPEGFTSASTLSDFGVIFTPNFTPGTLDAARLQGFLQYLP